MPSRVLTWYIYLEEPTQTDANMLRLLQTDHFYTTDPTDPAEYTALFNTLEQPILSFGGKWVLQQPSPI
jgi:hypothetical protein